MQGQPAAGGGVGLFARRSSSYAPKLMFAVAAVMVRARSDATNAATCAGIASGGVGAPEHMVDGFAAGADAVLAASIFHYGSYSVAEVKARLAAAGVSVRR